jgi:hypothetical protein
VRVGLHSDLAEVIARIIRTERNLNDALLAVWWNLAGVFALCWKFAVRQELTVAWVVLVQLERFSADGHRHDSEIDGRLKASCGVVDQRDAQRPGAVNRDLPKADCAFAKGRAERHVVVGASVIRRRGINGRL